MGKMLPPCLVLSGRVASVPVRTRDWWDDVAAAGVDVVWTLLRAQLKGLRQDLAAARAAEAVAERQSKEQGNMAADALGE